MSDPNGDTLDGAKKPETPGAPANTPPNGQSQPSGDDKNEVERANARAATAQQAEADAKKDAREARRALKIAEAKLAAKGGDGDGGDDGANPGGSPAPGSAEAQVVQARAESRIARLIASDPRYSELTAKDATLKDILYRNPLSLIPNYIDEDDAVEQVQEYLDGKLSPAAPAPAPATTEAQREVPKPGGEPAGGAAQPKYTAESIRNMPAAEWIKIPVEQRQKMMRGDFS